MFYENMEEFLEFYFDQKLPKRNMVILNYRFQKETATNSIQIPNVY